ncbi:hypothetical protein Daus18300_000444 [Diaporthe australafricana]|uniref:DUF6594 domain-containing protein n=1 Tax=Diaporthe australafricana TaxID=127596 RepID=A0ABR3Y4I1_9PEZI
MASRTSTERNNSRCTESSPETNATATRVTDEVTGGQATQEEIQRKPWKFIGYKGYSKFIASDNDFFILRRFGTLSSRVALSLQDEIVELEERLEECDVAYSSRDGEDVNNGTFRDDLPDRKELLQVIGKRITRYNDFILQQSLVRKSPRAPRRDIKSIRNWHFNHDYAAISPKEQEYLNHASEDDLIRVVHVDKTPLRRLVDSSLRLRTLRLWKDKKDDIPSYDAANVEYFLDKRMDRFSSAVIVAIGVAMLITPIWILQALESLPTKLGTITAFVSVFLVVVSMIMVSKPLEALSATAAYTAILMVFVQVGTEN